MKKVDYEHVINITSKLSKTIHNCILLKTFELYACKNLKRLMNVGTEDVFLGYASGIAPLIGEPRL